MSALEVILEWSAERPPWQRDALRRIVTQDEVTEQDLAELLQICLGSHGITFGVPPEPAPLPLVAEHLYHELRVPRGVPGVAVVEERVDLLHLLLEREELLRPLGQLLFIVVVIVAISATFSPPVLGVSAVEPHVAGVRRGSDHGRHEALEVRLVDRAVADAELTEEVEGWALDQESTTPP